MGDIVKFASGGALASAKALRANLATVKAAIPASSGLSYLRFLTDGSWVFGQENKELDAYNAKKARAPGNEGDEIAFNPHSIQTGFTCWTDYPAADKRKNENLGEVLVPLGQPVPLKHTLPDKGWDWKEIVVIEGVVLTGKYKGEPVKFTASSKGALNMANAIITQVIAQLDESEEMIVPVIELGSDWYTHKQWSKTYVPTFELVEFINMDGVSAAAGEPEPEATEARKRADEQKAVARARKPEPEPEPELEPEPEPEPEPPAEGTATRRRRR